MSTGLVIIRTSLTRSHLWYILCILLFYGGHRMVLIAPVREASDAITGIFPRFKIGVGNLRSWSCVCIYPVQLLLDQLQGMTHSG